MMKIFYTTTEAAEICRVSRSTVLRWIREHRLPASETFGGHHRIEASDLIRVLEKLGLEMPSGLSRYSQPPDDPKALLVIENQTDLQKIDRFLRAYFSIISTEQNIDAFCLGSLIQKHLPALIILDAACSKFDIQRSVRNIRKMKDCYCPVIAVWGSERAEGSDYCLDRPFKEEVFLSFIQKFWSLKPERKFAA